MISVRDHFLLKMINYFFGQKIRQSQFFTTEGKRIPVTLIEAGSNFMVSTKKQNEDGSQTVNIAFGRSRKNEQKINKAILGIYKKAGISQRPRFLREIKTVDAEIKLGQEIKAGEVFKVGDIIDVTGISKGKGFAGVVKRYHFKGGPHTHGQSDRERAPGSIGQTTTPGRVYRGKRMAGHMGVDKVTVKNLEVVAVDQEKNLLIIKGLVPGGKNSILTIKKVKTK